MNKKSTGTKKEKPLAGKELVDAIVAALEEKLAERVVIINLKEVSSIADWFIICQGDNTSHTSAIASGVIGTLKDKHKTAPWHNEGVEDGRWALIDYTDVVVHVMLPDVRQMYDLESLWIKKTESQPDKAQG
ncbi:MAG: ribosome silencing factor [Chitinispirillia bacterium]|nr:ribosome silencing factor [Chitinispirillia bacterium]MCL2269079.1 ribosome silencing factor [Chitinispirillia bacterium]